MTVGRLPLLLLLLAGVAVLAWYDRQSREEETSPPDRATKADRVARAARGDARRDTADAADQEGARDASAAGFNPNPLATLEPSTLEATLERPLFAPDRRRPPPKKIVVRRPPPAPVKPPPTPPSFELLGVISNQDRTIAVLRGSDRRTIRVEQGDVVSGWRVAKITRNSIVLEHTEGVSSQIEMFRP